MPASVPREVFHATCNDALTRIGNALKTVADQFGRNDFPNDGGVSFRDRLFGYSCGWFDAAKYYIYEEPHDKWAVTNSEKTLRLRPEHLVRVAGACHFFSEMRRFHNAIHQHKALGSSLETGTLLKKTLDWLTNTYNPAGDYGQAWFQLVTRTTDGDAYFKQSEELTYREISYAIMADPAVTDDSWTGLALAADLIRQPADDPTWQKVCQDFFGE